MGRFVVEQSAFDIETNERPQVSDRVLGVGRSILFRISMRFITFRVYGAVEIYFSGVEKFCNRGDEGETCDSVYMNSTGFCGRFNGFTKEFQGVCESGLVCRSVLERCEEIVQKF